MMHVLETAEAHRAALSDRPVTVFPRADCQVNLLMLPASRTGLVRCPSWYYLTKTVL